MCRFAENDPLKFCGFMFIEKYYLNVFNIFKKALYKFSAAKYLFCFCLMLAGNSLIAQILKGSYLVGGSADASLSFNYTTRSLNVSLQPTFAAFVVNNFAIGAIYSFGISGSHTPAVGTVPAKETNGFNTSLGPYLKYYIGKKRMKGVLSGNAGFAITTGLRTETNRSPSQAYLGFTAGGTAGMAYFFNEHISLEPCFYFTASGYQTILPTTRMGISLGLFAVLTKRKPAPVVAK